MMEEYESVLLMKSEVYVYNIPPRTSNRAYRAADWNLSEPSWTGRLRLVAKANKCILKLEDKNTGKLFAQCPVDTFPGVAIETVTDSSRYFVIKIVNDDGRSAFIGMGFGDRSDSFDFNVALQDHFKWLKKEKEFDDDANKPGVDFRFKEGETIKINMKITKRDGAENSVKAKPKIFGTGILPPPPGSKISPSSDKPQSSSQQSSTNKSDPTVEKTATNQTFSNWVQF